MKLAHLGDIHLGFFQYDRVLPGGYNVREEDVALAFRRAIADVIAQRPDVVVFAGDLFHRVRPGNRAIVLFEEQLAALRTALPEAAVVIVAGDHDTPKLKETGFILNVAPHFGVHLATLEPLVVPVLGGTITAVPNAAIGAMPAPPAEPGQHVLVSHGDIAGYGAPAPERGLDPDALVRAGWAYVALGHYHVCVEVRPRVWYAGALEYTATDPWAEMRKQAELGLPGKGWLLVTLGDGAPVVEFRPIGPSRRYLDLEPIDATGLSVEQIDAALAERIGAIDLDGACVRLIVREIPRDYKRALNYKLIREWKARALNLNLDMRGPSNVGTKASRAQMHKTLDEYVETLLGQRELPAGMERTAFMERGMEYFRAAAAVGDPYAVGEERQS
jgi:DNA repair exonuclease SbcCD nuclease subunit